MLKIVAIEDDEKVKKNIQELVRKLSIQLDKELSIVFYTTYNNKLENEINDHSIHKVYVIDIELSNSKLNGIDIAEKIRETNWEDEIIFLTVHDRMFETAHRRVVETFDFIEKFMDGENRLSEDLKKIIYRKDDNKCLKITNKYIDLQLYQSSILYIFRDKKERKSIIHTNIGTDFEVNYSLIDLLNMLDKRFIQTHKSCIVNKDHIIKKNFHEGYFTLDNNEEIYYLSKNYKDNFNE